jgi:hypothetical protein
MSYSSSARRRLWLKRLGYDASTIDGPQASKLIDEASATGRYKQPPVASQKRLAKQLGVDVSGERTCYDAASKLYEILHLRTWIYSVCRSLTGSKATTHGAVGLGEAAATALAREMLAAGFFEKIQRFGTTDSHEGDVWYRMGKGPQASPAFQYVAERLEGTVKTRKPAKGRTKGSKQSGCGFVFALLAALALGILVLAK